MNRPKVLHVGGILYWTIRTRNPDTQLLKDADSTPTVVIRKNNSSTGDSVTVTKRSATTGIYDCSYNPAGEVEGDGFNVEETAVVTGTTTTQQTYSTSWEFTVIAVERGTDGANTISPANSTIADISSRIPAALEGGRIAAALDSANRSTLVDEIWDEVLTGATHNVASSAGRRIRQINAFQQVDGSVNDLAASTLSFVTDLVSSVNDFYNDSMLVFTTGALAGQVRAIVDYVGSTKTITVEEALTSAPANGSEFTIVSLHIHPVSQIQSGLATAASITTLRGADNDTLKTLSDQIDGIGGGGGGSGDASQATLLEVKAKTDLIGSAAGVTALLAASVLEPGAITSFPETLRIGDSYTDVLGRAIQLPVVDTDGSPLTSAGSKDFADATATFVIKRANDTEDSRIITGTAVFVDPPGTGTSEAPYALIEIPSSETAKGLVKYRYTGLLTFTWPYVGTGTDAEVMTFETGTIVFES